MALQFTRNAKVYVQLVDDNGAHKAAWQISVLDGFSFTQSVNSSEITINEAGEQSRRARLLFNDSLAPVEWSLSTYARPFKGAASGFLANNVHGIEEALWAMLMGADTWDPVNQDFSNTRITFDNSSDADVNAVTTTTNTFGFSASNVSSMSDNWNIYFSFEDGANKQLYKCASAVVNSVSMDFDIDGIATLSWSGFAKELSDEGKVAFTESARNATTTYVDGGGVNLSIALANHNYIVGDTLNVIFAGSTANDGSDGVFVVSERTDDNNFKIAFGGSPAPTSGAEALTVQKYYITEALTDSTNFIRNRISTVDLVRKDKLIGSPDSGVVTGITVDGVNATGQAVLNVTGDISNVQVGDTVSVAGFVTSNQTVASILGQAITLSADIDVETVGGEPVVITSVLYDRYNLVLTGGNITIENNISYLTPEELGLVNQPLANITGARSISGSMTCYLDNDQTTSKSGELFADLVADNDTVRNTFDLSLNVGGEEANTPRVSFDLPTAHLEVPVVNVEDLLTLEVSFHGQVSSGNVDKTDEATIIYKA